MRRMTGMILAALLACPPLPAGAQAPESAPAAAPADTAAAVPTPPVLARPGGVNPTLAVTMSAPVPGWGQLYADNGWRGVLAFGAQAFYLGHVLMHDRKAVRLQAYARSLPEEQSGLRPLLDARVEEEWELMRDYAWWSLGALFIIALDAYVGAHLHRFDEDPVPVPELWDPAEQPLPVELPDPAGPPGVVLLQWQTGF